jgi:hypothetical protein
MTLAQLHAAAAFCLAVAAMLIMGALDASAWRVLAFGLFVFAGLFIAFSFGTGIPPSLGLLR